MGYLILLALIAAAILLSGCAAKRRPQRSAPAPAQISTIEVRRAVTLNREKTQAAKTRIEYVTKTIETIKETTDPDTARRLGEVQAELFKVTVELREAIEATTRAEEQVVILDKQAEGLRSWGLAQQRTAEENAVGWQKEEGEHQKARIELTKARAVANKRGNLVGGLGAFGLGALGLKAMTWFPPYSFALPVVGALIGYFGARFIL